MTKIQRRKIEQRPEVLRILALATEALEGATEVRKRVRRSLEAAEKCGQMLNREKRHVTREFGHGAWLSYFEINFSKTFNIRTAQGWMKLKNAIAHSTKAELSDITAPEKTEIEDANSLRLGMLALGLFPKKTALTIAGNRPVPRLNESYLAHLSWLEDWIDETTAQPLTPELVAQFKVDWLKVSKFCSSLATASP